MFSRPFCQLFHSHPLLRHSLPLLTALSWWQLREQANFFWRSLVLWPNGARIGKHEACKLCGRQPTYLEIPLYICRNICRHVIDIILALKKKINIFLSLALLFFSAHDSHDLVASNCQQLSGLEEKVIPGFWSNCIRKKNKCDHTNHVSVYYILDLSRLKHFDFKPTIKQHFAGLLLTRHAALWKIKASYHRAQHPACYSWWQRLVFILDICIICTGISASYYPQIDD